MRLGRWIFVLFQIVWLNMVLPGHTRGAVTAPGGERKFTSACGCESESPANSKSKKPSERDKQRCAFCFFVAGLTVAPPVTFWQPLVDQIEEVHAAMQNQLVSQHVFSTLHGRAPPCV